MASIQSKKSKSGRSTYYVVVAHAGKRKWLKAGSLKEARILKKQIESLDNSNRLEKLGLTSKQIRLHEFFEKFDEYVSFHNTASTAKRYLSVVRAFQEFLRMFHPAVMILGQVNREHIDSYQMKRLESIELAQAVNSNPKNWKLHYYLAVTLRKIGALTGRREKSSEIVSMILGRA